MLIRSCFPLYFIVLISLNADSSRDSNVFRKVGGRHGMVFGYVSPKAIHLPPLVPGTVPRLGLVCLLDVTIVVVRRSVVTSVCIAACYQSFECLVFYSDGVADDLLSMQCGFIYLWCISITIIAHLSCFKWS